MKKITLLRFFIGAPSFAQVTTYTDATTFDAVYVGANDI